VEQELVGTGLPVAVLADEPLVGFLEMVQALYGAGAKVEERRPLELAPHLTLLLELGQ
jgi:hypothetical protein